MAAQILLLFSLITPASPLTPGPSSLGPFPPSSRRRTVELAAPATAGIIYPIVALTREAGKNAGLAKALELAGGLHTLEVPCVAQTRTPQMETALDAALLFVDEPWDWVVVTSPEAARTFGDAAKRSGLFMMRDKKWRGFRLAAVGGATAEALEARETGAWRHVFSPPKATAAALAESLPRGEGPERVLYPTSALAASTLEDGLTKRGFDVTRVDAYTTEPAPWTGDDREAAAAAQIVAFGSPSAARVWADRVGVHQTCACIGATSADACRALGFSSVFHPEQPGVAGWAAAVREAAASLPAGGSD